MKYYKRLSHGKQLCSLFNSNRLFQVVSRLSTFDFCLSDTEVSIIFSGASPVSIILKKAVLSKIILGIKQLNT